MYVYIIFFYFKTRSSSDTWIDVYTSVIKQALERGYIICTKSWMHLEETISTAAWH